MYLIHKGSVKLYATNDMPFASFNIGNSFGEPEMILNYKRNGIAKTG